MSDMTPKLAAEVRALVAEAQTLAADVDEELAAIVERAASEPFTDAEARELFTKIVTAVRLYRHEVAHPSGPIPASEDDYEIATRVVARIAAREAVSLDGGRNGGSSPAESHAPTKGMDYPQAWAFVKTTKPDDHDPRCSWRTQNGALLCDCDVIWNEYVRLGGSDPRAESGRP